MFATGCWCYFAGCWWCARVLAGYFGVINSGDRKGLVRKDRGYGGYEYGSENGGVGGGKKVVFDVKTEEDGVKHSNEEEKEEEKVQSNEVNGTVEVKEEEGVVDNAAAAAADMKVEEEGDRQVREESPSQHSEGDYLDIRSGGRG